MFKKGDIVKVVSHYNAQGCVNTLAPIGTTGIVVMYASTSSPSTSVRWFSREFYEWGMYDVELEKIGEADEGR
jgi:hypothetical protein